ncbi:MAG: nuclear transport factor 2 family protein [Solirubrobacterales bacterium]|nr:nuclear transport factor 2 family protein [Solirubrobacterales bacterium]
MRTNRKDDVKLKSLLAGAALALAARALFPRLLLAKFSSDVEKLNAGDHRSLLDAYGDDFVLHFAEGDHRWSGDWVGKAGMDRFLQNFTAAGIKGEIRGIATSGPLWALTMWVRFDDHADAPDGTRIYENSTVLVLRTRWGKVVEQHDFYADTERIAAFDRKLTELGVEGVARTA